MRGGNTDTNDTSILQITELINYVVSHLNISSTPSRWLSKILTYNSNIKGAEIKKSFNQLKYRISEIVFLLYYWEVFT